MRKRWKTHRSKFRSLVKEADYITVIEDKGFIPTGTWSGGQLSEYEAHSILAFKPYWNSDNGLWNYRYGHDIETGMWNEDYYPEFGNSWLRD